MYQVPIDAEGELGVQSLVGKTETSGEAYLLQPLCVCVSVCVCVRSSSKDLVMLSETGIFGMWFSIASR